MAGTGAANRMAGTGAANRMTETGAPSGMVKIGGNQTVNGLRGMATSLAMPNPMSSLLAILDSHGGGVGAGIHGLVGAGAHGMDGAGDIPLTATIIMATLTLTTGQCD